MRFGPNPFNWWTRAFQPAPSKDTIKVKITEVYETTLNVPKDIPYDRRREWAYLDKKLNKGQVVRLSQRYKEEE